MKDLALILISRRSCMKAESCMDLIQDDFFKGVWMAV